MPSSVSPQDPIAVVVASVIAIVGALGLWSRWGLTADHVAQLGGAALAIAAVLRTYLTARKPAEPSETAPGLQRLTIDAHPRVFDALGVAPPKDTADV